MEIFIQLYNFFGVPLGILLGFIIQHYLSSRQKIIEQSKEKQLTAYSDYIRALSDSSFCKNSNDKVEIQKRATDAKTRIIIYGDDRVLKSLHEFDLSGSTAFTDIGRDRLADLIISMRGKDSLISKQSILRIMFGINS